MLFKQRNEPGYRDRLRVWLWPRVSWRRSALYYVKRILRLSGTPYAIAMGAAVGAGVATTPFLGFHFVLTAVVAWLLGGNLIAGAIGTCIGNPLTFPLIWASTYRLGSVILNAEGLHPPGGIGHDLLHKSWDQLWPILEPMMVGAVPVALLTGAIMYVIVYKGVSAYRESRIQRFAGRRTQAGSPAE